MERRKATTSTNSIYGAPKIPNLWLLSHYIPDAVKTAKFNCGKLGRNYGEHCNKEQLWNAGNIVTIANSKHSCFIQKRELQELMYGTPNSHNFSFCGVAALQLSWYRIRKAAVISREWTGKNTFPGDEYSELLNIKLSAYTPRLPSSTKETIQVYSVKHICIYCYME